ncbi:hypothetical protein ACWEWD_20565 [Streptomyces tendae]
MFIRIDSTGEGFSTVLAEPDDFTAFAVRLGPGLDEEQVSSAVARLGRAEDADHVHVPVEVLTELAGDRADDLQWRSGLDGMTAYARSKGWLDAHGGIRAHIERPAA